MTKPEPLTQATATSPHDQRRFKLVHPQQWQNPEPDGDYHLVVIGAGAAGLITAAGAAGVGARVALIERANLGGDCLNVGCVPSKGVIRASRAMAAVAEASEFGISVGRIDFDFSTAMERMRKIRADISQVDSAERYSQELGVDIFIGEASFAGGKKVSVGDSVLTFRKAVIASGARAAAPPIPGLDQTGYRTNETIFDLDQLPETLFVIGAGPIGCELAQSFARFGSKVHVADMSKRVLPREDADAAELIQQSMASDGVEMHLGVSIDGVEESDGRKKITITSGGESRTIAANELLISAGRRPNIDSLNLEAVGVKSGRRGVEVNDRLQTTNKHIYAVGDVAVPYQFTHMADATARIVIQNALFKGRKKWTDLIVPWCTYTEPELAHVGLSKQGAAEQGLEFDEYKISFDDIDRSRLEGDESGFVSVLTTSGGDKILGATIVNGNAGEMLNEITVAMVNGLGLGSLANVIHPYPTQAEAIRRAADAFNRTRLTPFAARVLKFLLKFV